MKLSAVWAKGQGIRAKANTQAEEINRNLSSGGCADWIRGAPPNRIQDSFKSMTYNFDPDRWYEDERGILASRYKAGEISERQHNAAISDLNRRYDEMLTRLDGTYQIPK
jgi:hypothetical protein